MGRRILAVALALFGIAAYADDGPTIRLGGTLFTDFTYQSSPETRDADGNAVNPSSFNVTRAYVNVTGTIVPRLSYRITPDIVRETGSGSSLAGSQTFRLKFAYVQLGLDDWTTRGSFVRVGMQQSPYLEFIENFYRYRFQGPTFLDREGYLFSADTGVAGQWTIPGDYGEVRAGFFNGEGFARAETNDQKSVQLRATFRPLPKHRLLQGLRLSAFAIDDHFVEEAPRRRLVGAATFEHPRVNGGLEYLTATDRPSARARAIDASGVSLWVTPRIGRRLEALLRVDRLRPDDAGGSRKSRDIAGIAWWPAMPKGTSAAIMLDRDAVRYSGFEAAREREVRWGVHLLLAF